MDEVTIVDRVQVDLDDLGKLDHHIAIPPAEPVDVVYVNTENGDRRRQRVFGFTATGRALVLPDRGTHLATASESQKPKERPYLRRVTMFNDEDMPVGPFTPAPTGLTAVFTDGRRQPIAYYDVHGRAICIHHDDSRSLFVLDEDALFDHVEGEPDI